MERPQHLHPQKSSSFSASTTREDKKLRETDRNLSLDSNIISRHDTNATLALSLDVDRPSPIAEGEEAAADEPNLTTFSEAIDRLITLLHDTSSSDNTRPEIPVDTVDRFISLVEREIIRYEASDVEKWSPDNEQAPLLDAIDRLSKLSSALSSDHFEPMSRAGGVLHHAMSFLEDELFLILDEPRSKQQQQQLDQASKPKRGPSFASRDVQSDRCALPGLPQPPVEPDPDPSPPYPPEAVSRLRSIAGAMISGGYGTECHQVFTVARRNAIDAAISDLGFEKVSIDDVQRMAWDSLEAEIAKWIKAFRHAVTESFPHERDLCNKVFAGHGGGDLAAAVFRSIAGGVLFHLLSFAEAVAMTKRSAEKLFKVLDMYEAIRDMTPKIQDLFEEEEDRELETADQTSSPSSTSALPADLKSEISSARARIGDAAVAIFCDLEGSIKSDTGRTPVPGGAVHPLTRYVMNYLKYVCEYKNTLEQVFREHQKLEKGPSMSSCDDYDGGGSNSNRNSNASTDRSPFAAQLVEVMDLLHSSIEAKSKLYKDLALSNIFMMNNGRYIVQKIKGSSEMNQLLGDTWSRRRSSDLRQYHKNYQRETWSRVLACLRDEGLTTGKGGVQKPVLKERFKSFSAMIEEIHKTQSSWVVSDEQLQSELRVSVSAVVVPAYRSFLGRFSQYLDPGRQTEKYIKFGPEDLENYIDELFDGNQQSTMRRRT